MGRGYTAQVLEPFIEGMQKAEAEVRLIYAHKLRIKPCIGEFHCWFKNPGECILKDDMQPVYKKLADSHILIIATPVYVPLPGNMQKLINRLVPLMEPILENKDGRTRARFHDGIKIRKIMLVASSGWWELGNFDTLKHIIAEMAANFNVEFGGSVLRPHASAMDSRPQEKKSIKAALVEAGYQLIKEGKISPEILQSISRPLITFEDYLKGETDQYLSIKKPQR